MGFLRNMLLAVGALAAAEVGLVAPFRAPLAVLLLLALPSLLAAAALALGRRGRWRTAGLAAAAVGWSAPFVQLLAVALCGWTETAAELFGGGNTFASWPGPELLIALAPYVAAELVAIDARARTASLVPAVRSGVRRLHARMFLSALGPIAGLVLLSSVIGLNAGLRAWVEEVALLNGAVTAALLAIFALLMPAILVNAWKTAPLPDGWQRRVLDDTARRAGFRCRDIRVWHTSHLMANAAVVGFLPRHRVVLFSDALLAELGPAELAAVFAHEIGHATRRHVWIFGAWALGCLMLADAGLRALELESQPGELALFALVMALGYAAFGYLSRRFELDADLESVATTGDTYGLIRALEQVGGAHARERRGWRHFSVADRVRFLAAAAEDPEVGLRLRRKLRRWAMLGTALFVVAAGLELWSLARSLPTDRVVVDLRLGRYQAAAERSEGLQLEPRLAAALAAGRGIADGAPGEMLLERARARLAAGDARDALAFLDLAAVRGGDVPDGVADVLLALVELDGERARDALESVSDPSWRAALAPILLGKRFAPPDVPPRAREQATLWG